MHRFAGFTALFLLFVLSPTMGMTKTAVARQPEPPLVRAVLFRADWCANCHILEPVLEQAMVQAVGVPVELVVLDFTDAARWDQSIEIALDHDVVGIYNAYAGITGLVVLTSADTGERIDCINRTFSAPAMVHAMEKAVLTVQTTPPGDRSAKSVFCPPGRAPLN